MYYTSTFISRKAHVKLQVSTHIMSLALTPYVPSQQALQKGAREIREVQFRIHNAVTTAPLERCAQLDALTLMCECQMTLSQLPELDCARLCNKKRMLEQYIDNC